jgi:tetratricopeptide (TPR) repeat protein
MKMVIRVLSVVAALSMVAAAGDTPEQLIKAGHWKRARPLIEAALKQSPNDSHALVLKGRLERATGDLEASRGSLDRAVKADPKNAEAHFELANTIGELAQKGGMLKGIGLAGQYKKEVDAALAINPNYWEAHWDWFQLYLNAPGIAGGSRDKAQAKQAEIARLNPAQGYFAQAEIDLHDKHRERVEELYRKAHESAPSDYAVAVPICRLYTGDKRWPEAEKCSAELIRMQPDRVTGYILAAHAYASQNKWADLDRLMPRAEANVPDNLTPFFQAGSVLAVSGADNARGERYLRHYLEQEPEIGAPKWSRAHWRLGQVLEKQGRKPDAIAEYQKAVQMEPSFEPAQKDLKRLK